ncbi:XrtA-associated tyrosine autokinase [Halorhodospira neutriphila]|uniref:non-specific protein-tyrosine kinase n=1 Tax=Halorhodospira neutriphila TaxID=168379 RepID=A0ABS1E619_9GAMM|nr:XrtA-associated tyrosine autokinase [Halorhodospira neutriphila]MBK1726968.1 protein tyrosine kinase [Halorhodospira neutriphila]
MSIIEKALEKRRSQDRSQGQEAPADEAPDRGAAPGGAEAGEPAGPESPWGSDEGSDRDVDVEIDFGWLRHQGLQVPGEHRTGLEEEFRIMKRPVLENAFGRGGVSPVEKGRLVMLTSALPGEGKTFCTLNLALSLAMEVERTVLVVDADVARPNVPWSLGFEADRGLMDLLTDASVALPDVLLRTQIPNLSVLPCGRPQGRSTELLASRAMSELLEDIHSRYSDRIVVFDTPPLLASSEPSVLARQMGQVLLVVEAESTARVAVTRAVELLDGCDVVLGLLNKSSNIPGIGYGGYGGYGYYGSHYTASPSSDPRDLGAAAAQTG